MMGSIMSSYGFHSILQSKMVLFLFHVQKECDGYFVAKLRKYSDIAKELPKKTAYNLPEIK